MSRQKTHGQSNGGGRSQVTRAYQVWQHIRQRCRREAASDYHWYGGRGIKVCERWQRFENFYADMGDPPAGMSIDRIDNDGDYTPANCRWATPQMQANNRRSNRIIHYQDTPYTVMELSRLTGVNRRTLVARLDKGWSVNAAVIPAH